MTHLFHIVWRIIDISRRRILALLQMKNIWLAIRVYRRTAAGTVKSAHWGNFERSVEMVEKRFTGFRTFQSFMIGLTSLHAHEVRMTDCMDIRQERFARTGFGWVKVLPVGEHE